MTLQALKILIWGWFKDPDEGLEPENWPIGVGGGEGRGEFMARDSKGLQPRTNRLFWEIFWKMFMTMSCFTYLSTAPCHLDSAKLPYFHFRQQAILAWSNLFAIIFPLLPSFSFLLHVLLLLIIFFSSAPSSGPTQSRIFSPLSVEPVIVFAMDLQTYSCCIVFVFLMALQCMGPSKVELMD